MPRWSSFDVAADRRLVQRLNEGDEAALGALYDAYAERLYDYCLTMTGEHKTAADVVHDTFIDAFRRAPRMRDRIRLRPWLYAAARRRCLQRGRVRGLTWEKDAEFADDTLRGLLDAALTRLTFPDQEVLLLALRHGLRSPELGAALGNSSRRAAGRLSRAQARLRTAIDAELVVLEQRCADGGRPVRALQAEDAERELIGHAEALDLPAGEPRSKRPGGGTGTPRRAAAVVVAAAHPAARLTGSTRRAARSAEPAASAAAATSAEAPPASPPEREPAEPAEPAEAEFEASDHRLDEVEHDDHAVEPDRTDRPDQAALADRADPAGGAGPAGRTESAGRPDPAGRNDLAGRAAPAGRDGQVDRVAAVTGEGRDAGGAWAMRDAHTPIGGQVVRAASLTDRLFSPTTAPDEAALERHAADCAECSARRRLTPAALIVMAPSPVLPAALRHRVIHTGTDPELAGYRTDIAARGGGLTPDGLPSQPDVPSPVCRRWLFSGGGMAGALATAVVVALLMGPGKSIINWPPLGAGPQPAVTEQRPPDGGAGNGGSRPGQSGQPGNGTGGAGSPNSPQLDGDRETVPSPVPVRPPSAEPKVPGVLSAAPARVEFYGTKTARVVLTAHKGPVTWTSASGSGQVIVTPSQGVLAKGRSAELTLTLRTALVGLPGTSTVTFTDLEGKRQEVTVVWGISLL
ncbi:sigma-70 family RNA polymerase sigma factor [Spirillospora sp. NPDC047279]|uniref:sigma-70 family RNA polymerase sigma factor n=1 Tax=Spirillospora sp. NPDC047279 TaxID=3155478 RepID=UPI0033F3425E